MPSKLPRSIRDRCALVVPLVCVLAAGGCGAASSPGLTPPPRTSVPERSASTAVANAADSVGGIPGSPNAMFVYKFRMTGPPGASSFAYRDRDVSFAFRPSPNALYFSVENLQGRPVQIDWDRSTFYDATGRSTKVGHSTTRWADRYSPEPITQVNGQQRYSDYVFARDDLLDPGGTPDTQLRRPLLPEDTSAPTYVDKTFGVDLVLVIENQPRTYPVRFVVAAAIPK
jgi:hypothetical protein